MALALAWGRPALTQTAANADRQQTKTALGVSTLEATGRTQATLTATVSGSGEAGPTGSVTFLDGDRSIGAAFVDEEGRATLTVDALPPGVRKITAKYEGDEVHSASNSTVAAVNSVASGVPGFTLSASPASLTAVAGQTATTVIAATPENGFNQAVALSCSGVPVVSVTCVFSPLNITPGPPTTAAPAGTAALSTLSIQTTAYSGALRDLPGVSNRTETVYAVAVPGLLALAGLGLVRKRAFRGASWLSLIALLLAGSLGLGGCSQRYKYFHKPPTGNPGTPAGTYTVVISGLTGTGSSLSTGTINVTMVVTAK